MEQLDTLSREDIRRVQLCKLNRLLLREKERGGFYKDLPEHLESLEQLRELPFTTEEDLIQNGNRMVLLSQSEIDRVRTEETSGTTGMSKRIFYSDRDNERTISFFAAGLSELVREGEKTMICMPFSGHHGLGELIAEAIRRLGAFPVEAGIGRTYEELSRILKEERPETFVGMPVPLLSMLRLCPGCSLKRALVSADACPVTVMEELERLLGSRLYPHYGSRETGLGGAVTCPGFAGMHLRENDIIAEIVDEAGQALPPGTWGELVITTIEAEAMPLIRYRTGDHARILPEDCPCRSSLCRLDRVTRLGEKGSMAKLDEVMLRFPQVVDYRAFAEEEELLIEGYLMDEEQEFPEKWEGYPVRYRWTRASGQDTPCYPAKRRILPGRNK
ncbi:MAG: AMP-binding protein [Clostridiales bacterium]|nr:AMP-binding protein [Clostridiales bacterium]